MLGIFTDVDTKILNNTADRFNISFFSNSDEVMDSVPQEVLDQWNVFFISPGKTPILEGNTKRTSLIIVDTYSLGVDFLQHTCGGEDPLQCPVLVLDHYTERLFINNLFDKGVKGYLLVHSYEDELLEAAHHLIKGQQYTSVLIDEYKGNTYM